MTALHSKTHRLYVGGYDLSAYFKQFQTDESVSDADVTTFVSTAREFQPGKSEDSASGTGMETADPTLVRNVLVAALGTTGSYVVSVPVDTAGQQGFALPAFQAKWALGFPQDDIVDVQVEWKAEGGAMHPYVLVPAASAAATVTGDQVDLGAGTHDVQVLSQLLEMTTFTGVVVKLQDRATTGDAWVDVASSSTASLTETDFELVTLSGVKRYVRAVATPAGTPGTFAVSTVIDVTS